METVGLNEAEIEVVGLCIATEAINNFANKTMLKVIPCSECPSQAVVYFQDSVHQDLFLARLLDFSNERADQSLTGIQGSCLDVLGNTCNMHSLGSAKSVNALDAAVEDFRTWLNDRITLQMWIPTLDKTVILPMPRTQLVYIMGNCVKHNLARLTAVSRCIGKQFREHRYSVSDEQVPFVLEDIRAHLKDDYFIYYSTQLAEMVNNLRWGVQDYLQPVFENSYSKPNGELYRYEYLYPELIRTPIAREWFWRLMNLVRSQPYIERFSCASYLKGRASIELDSAETDGK